jgi:adenylate kinase family enzyme
MVAIPAKETPSLVRHVVTSVRLRARRRAEWLGRLYRRDAPEASAEAAPPRPEPWLEGWDDADAERRFQAHADLLPLAAEIAGHEHALAGPDSRLVRLRRIFDLDDAELDYVKVCLAAAIDGSLARALAYLTEDGTQAHLTERLVARLYGHGVSRVLTSESALRRWDLVHATPVAPGEPDVLTLDPLVRDWLVGDHGLDPALLGCAGLCPPLSPLPRWPVEATAERLQRAHGRAHARVHVLGPPGSGRRTFAACVASELGLPLLVVSSDAVADDDWERVYLRAQRQAYLDGAALGWTGEAILARRWPELVPPFPVQFVIGEAGDHLPQRPFTVDETVELPAPTVSERAALFRLHVAEAGSWSEDALQALAANHRVTAGDVAAIGLRAPHSPAEAGAIVREASRHQLGDLARFVEASFEWDDLVVPEPLRCALRDLVFEAGERAVFWEQPSARRLFPQGRGLFALFTGTPGTGKTMAAQVLARALGLDLFRISLATVVSKYVGETSKNLHRILARAEAMDAVLLFDEADALFGKRTEIKDAHDRFANTDTNYLLQAIESYRGIAILATNKKANIDPAFTRRLRYVLEFPRPDPAHRRRLWERLVAELAGADRAAALAGPLGDLAAHVDASGAQIKYAVLASLFAARRDGTTLAARHLLYGLERELSKEGRALGDRERERVSAHGV